ncbi:MAG: tetratricopeptide repeat protein [Leptolyngbyaceae cyanobacterium SM1_3_5]|nr:tetratricopeptide repeat protein [Leptolyngbyaceae cyanobacterium SM1_3_5]
MRTTDLEILYMSKPSMRRRLKSYQQAIKLNLNHESAHYGLGNTLWKLKRYEEAIDSYQQVIELNPKHPWANNGLGNALYDLEKYEQAVESYQHAIKLNPNYDLFTATVEMLCGS